MSQSPPEHARRFNTPPVEEDLPVSPVHPTSVPPSPGNRRHGAGNGGGGGTGAHRGGGHFHHQVVGGHNGGATMNNHHHHHDPYNSSAQQHQQPQQGRQHRQQQQQQEDATNRSLKYRDDQDDDDVPEVSALTEVDPMPSPDKKKSNKDVPRHAQTTESFRAHSRPRRGETEAAEKTTKQKAATGKASRRALMAHVDGGESPAAAASDTTATPHNTSNDTMSVAVVDPSYQRGLAWTRQRDSALERLRQEKDKFEKKECTFHPEIHGSPEGTGRANSHRDITERLTALGQKSNEERQKLRQTQLQQERSQCTFKPEVHMSPRQIEAAKRNLEKHGRMQQQNDRSRTSSPILRTVADNGGSKNNNANNTTNSTGLNAGSSANNSPFRQQQDQTSFSRNNSNNSTSVQQQRAAIESAGDVFHNMSTYNQKHEDPKEEQRIADEQFIYSETAHVEDRTTMSRINHMLGTNWHSELDPECTFTPRISRRSETTAIALRRGEATQHMSAHERLYEQSYVAAERRKWLQLNSPYRRRGDGDDGGEDRSVSPSSRRRNNNDDLLSGAEGVETELLPSLNFELRNLRLHFATVEDPEHNDPIMTFYKNVLGTHDFAPADAQNFQDSDDEEAMMAHHRRKQTKKAKKKQQKRSVTGGEEETATTTTGGGETTTATTTNIYDEGEEEGETSDDEDDDTMDSRVVHMVRLTEFLKRQNERAKIKQDNLEKLRYETTPKAISFLTKHSKVLLKQKSERAAGEEADSVVTSSAGGPHGHNHTRAPYQDPDLRFKPNISKLARQKPARSVAELCQDAERRSTKIRDLRQQMEDQIDEDIRRGSAIAARGAGSGPPGESTLAVKNLGKYLSKIKREREKKEKERQEELRKRTMHEEREFTGKPRINETPEYIKEMAHSSVLLRGALMDHSSSSADKSSFLGNNSLSTSAKKKKRNAASPLRPYYPPNPHTNSSSIVMLNHGPRPGGPASDVSSGGSSLRHSSTNLLAPGGARQQRAASAAQASKNQGGGGGYAAAARRGPN